MAFLIHTQVLTLNVGIKAAISSLSFAANVALMVPNVKVDGGHVLP